MIPMIPIAEEKRLRVRVFGEERDILCRKTPNGAWASVENVVVCEIIERSMNLLNRRGVMAPG